MSKRIEVIIGILKYIRDNWGKNDLIKDIRISATKYVQRIEKIADCQTVQTKYTRELNLSTDEFDRLIKEWLVNSDVKLKEIILNHCVGKDYYDERLVLDFFEDIDKTKSRLRRPLPSINDKAEKQSKYIELVDKTLLPDKKLEKSQEELKKPRTINLTNDFHKQLKDIIKTATGKDKDYWEFIDKLEINKSTPIEISKKLELTLRTILAVKDRNMNLNELLIMAKQSNIIDSEAIYLAHLIRRHRNIIAHKDVDRRTDLPRVMLILFAATLLWPLLPE